MFAYQACKKPPPASPFESPPQSAAPPDDTIWKLWTEVRPQVDAYFCEEPLDEDAIIEGCLLLANWADGPALQC